MLGIVGGRSRVTTDPPPSSLKREGHRPVLAVLTCGSFGSHHDGPPKTKRGCQRHCVSRPFRPSTQTRLALQLFRVLPSPSPLAPAPSLLSHLSVRLVHSISVATTAQRARGRGCLGAAGSQWRALRPRSGEKHAPGRRRVFLCETWTSLWLTTNARRLEVVADRSSLVWGGGEGSGGRRHHSVVTGSCRWETSPALRPDRMEQPLLRSTNQTPDLPGVLWLSGAGEVGGTGS